MNIPTAIHRLANSRIGNVKTLQGKDGEKRLRVGEYRVRFKTAKMLTAKSAFDHFP